MIFNVIGLLIGILIFGAGIYYLVKEGKDSESKKIYSAFAVVGAVIIITLIAKMAFWG